MEKTKEDTDKIVTRRLVIELIILTFEIFYLLYLKLSSDNFNLLVESFNKIAVGLSALVAVIFGPDIVSRELEKDRKIKGYLERYPHDKFGISWKIIESENYPGAYYLFEIKDKMKHHILNMKTVYDLGWHIYLQKSDKLKDNEFQRYKIGDWIRTQGEAGE